MNYVFLTEGIIVECSIQKETCSRPNSSRVTECPSFYSPKVSGNYVDRVVARTLITGYTCVCVHQMRCVQRYTASAGVHDNKCVLK